MSTPEDSSSQDETLSIQPNTVDEEAFPPMRNHDGSVLLNERGGIVYRSQYLSTHPLRKDCMEKHGYDGRRLTYMTGDGIIRTMNAAFGHSGWGTQITREREVLCERDGQGRWSIGYAVTLRVSLENGVSHEDCGTGEGINESKVKAIDTAFKSAVTDAMKRAARHFGERLGNALYVKGSGIGTAPRDNKTALRTLEQAEANDLFGDQIQLQQMRAAGQGPAGLSSLNEDRGHGGGEESRNKKGLDASKCTPPNEPKNHARAQTRNGAVTGFTKASNIDPSTLVTPTARPVSSDGTHPTPPAFHRYAPLGESTNHTAQPQSRLPPQEQPPKRSASVDNSITAKRHKVARNPYDRH